MVLRTGLRDAQNLLESSLSDLLHAWSARWWKEAEPLMKNATYLPGTYTAVKQNPSPWKPQLHEYRNCWGQVQPGDSCRHASQDCATHFQAEASQLAHQSTQAQKSAPCAGTPRSTWTEPGPLCRLQSLPLPLRNRRRARMLPPLSGVEHADFREGQPGQ